jgi:FMN phosphatase YigB (HAD superfamily)
VQTLKNKKPRLVIFDVEGVLIPKNRFFFEVGKKLGFSPNRGYTAEIGFEKYVLQFERLRRLDPSAGCAKNPFDALRKGIV